MADDDQFDHQVDQVPTTSENDKLDATSSQGEPQKGRRLIYVDLSDENLPGVEHYETPGGHETVVQGSPLPKSSLRSNKTAGPIHERSDIGQPNELPDGAHASRSDKSSVSGVLPRMPEDQEADLFDEYHYEKTEDSKYEIDEERSTRRGSVSTMSVARYFDALPTSSTIDSKSQVQVVKDFENSRCGVQKVVVRGNGKLDVLIDGKWIPAVHHHTIRDKLLRLTDKHGKYDVGPSRGADENDRTAFHKDQMHWHFKDRSLRPDLLFTWDDPKDRDINIPGIWYDDGRMVLSAENRPLRKYREIPLTLSGQCEGLRLEMIRRLNPSISIWELMARMPLKTVKRSGLTEHTVEISTVGNRIALARSRTGMKAWSQRLRSDSRTHRMLQMIPEDIQREIIRTNSTSCFRDFNPAEIAYIDKAMKDTETSAQETSLGKLAEHVPGEREADEQLPANDKTGHNLLIHQVVAEALERATPVPKTQHVPRSVSSAKTTSSMSPHYPRSKGGQSKRAASPSKMMSSKRHKALEAGKLNQPGKVAERHNGSPSGGKAQGNQSGTDKTYVGPDYRHKKPATALEIRLIQWALKISRDDFTRLTGNPPVPTDRTESYSWQYSQLQAALSEHMGLGSQTPLLKRWGRWTSMESWGPVVASYVGGRGGVTNTASSVEGNTPAEKH
ncbi:MAG: hypothetical protein L6R41_006723 [Letrouitia leprolyta]|nr:MAG: hypothetical protein L6R41_006723 [Letrouitia leprolyta]